MKLLTLDGNSLINRAFYGIRPLTAPDGTPTNAVYGFLTILQKILSDEKPDALCVAFDVHGPTFRNELYSEYKAHRKPMPEELAAQIPILKEVLDAMNITRYELSGWEADDLLGAIAKKCQTENWECVVVTGDKDVLQLVTESTWVRHVKSRAGKTETISYTPDVFFEEYGFEPHKLVDLKALMGDSSDNIPGVSGIGEKTALDLVRRFGYLSEIYSKLSDLDIRDTVRKKLENGREDAFKSFELATIRTDVPIDIDVTESVLRVYDNDLLYGIFKRLGFRRLITEFGLRQPSGNPSYASTQDGIINESSSHSGSAIAAISEIINANTSKACESLLEKAKGAEYIAIRIDIEYFDSVAVALPNDSDVYILRRSTTENFDKALTALLDSNIKKAGHDIKDKIRVCLEHSIISNISDDGGWVFDTALAAYLVEPTENNYNISRISEAYTAFIPGASDDANGQMTLLEDSGKTLAQEAFAILLLKKALEIKLKELKLEKLFYDIELPLCHVLAEMEYSGFLVDKAALKDFGDSLGSELEDIEKRIYEFAGETFNINSPKQLGAILFDKLMLPAPKKTKTGYSTNAEVLDKLLGKHPIITQIKDYRELSKLKSTYTDGLLKVISSDGRIHTRFMMTVAATGRLSSTEPNLQNIPIRRKKGEEIRKMFIASEGNVLVDADYSQIELRLLAHIAGDPVMKNAFEQGEDIHSVTASQVFGVPIEEVTSLMRSRAKAVNFGIVYGISSFSLAQDIGVTGHEAKSYITSYLEKYSAVNQYMVDIVASAKKNGYVATLFGRRRYLPELKSANFNMRAFGERVALNMPIQGTAADIMKIAMINVFSRIKAENLKARLILQVHDELVVECPKCEAEKVSELLREEMKNAAMLSVPLIAETRVGKSWHDTK